MNEKKKIIRFLKDKNNKFTTFESVLNDFSQGKIEENFRIYGFTPICFTAVESNFNKKNIITFKIMFQFHNLICNVELDENGYNYDVKPIKSDENYVFEPVKLSYDKDFDYKKMTGLLFEKLKEVKEFDEKVNANERIIKESQNNIRLSKTRNVVTIILSVVMIVLAFVLPKSDEKPLNFMLGGFGLLFLVYGIIKVFGDKKRK